MTRATDKECHIINKMCEEIAIIIERDKNLGVSAIKCLLIEHCYQKLGFGKETFLEHMSRDWDFYKMESDHPPAPAHLKKRELVKTLYLGSDE